VIDYGTPAGQRRPGPGRPRGRKPLRWIVAAVVVVAAVAAALIAVHRPAGSPAPVSASTTQNSFRTTTPPLRLGACVDPTLSIVPSFAPAIRHDLAAGIGGLTPPTGPPATGTATAARPAVSLLVREVDTTSFSSDPGPYAAQVEIPGVPGLSQPRPVPSDANYSSGLTAWSQSAQAVTAGRTTAAAAVSDAAQELTSLPLDQNPASNSAITACVSALLVNLPADGRHSYLLASDLEENVPPELEGSFHGAPLFIVQTCDSGSVSDCQALLQHFETLMRRLQVGPVTVIRPEEAAVDIAQWIRTGKVAP
jgi:hypothetical protein